MKLCAACQTIHSAEQSTCLRCGEGSWIKLELPVVAFEPQPEPEPEPEPVQQPQRKGRRS